MHNHASYMFMHLIKLLCYSYTFAFSIPMLISVKINHVNFKFILSCRFQNPTVLSTSNLSSPFKFKLLRSCQVNSNLFLQYNLFLLTAKWLVRVQEQLVPVNLFLLTAKWLVRVQEQLVPVNLFLLTAKWLVRIQEQLVPVNLPLSSVKWLVQIREQLVPVLCFCCQPSD